MAFLSASTGALVNTFTANQSTDPAIVETFDHNEKTDVAVDVGDPGYAVYVRVAVVVTWKNGENGDVLGVVPVEGADYTITYNTEDWFKGSDGFYYHRDMVNSAENTAVLINSCQPVDGKTPEGYGLNVEIIAQTIQSLGTTDDGEVPAVTDAWGVKVENGKLVP